MPEHVGDSPIRDVALVGDHLAVVRQGSSDIELWDWRIGRLLRRLEGHTGPPLLAGFTLNGRTLVSWGESVADGSVTWWDVPSGAERGHVVGRAIAPALTTKGSAFSDFVESSRGVALTLPRPEVSPDGKLVVLVGQDGKLQVIDITTGKEVARVAITWNGSSCVGFTSDSKSLVVCDSLMSSTAKGKKGKVAKDEKPPPSGSAVRLLDLKSGVLEPDAGRRHSFFARRMAVAGGYALVACTDGLIRVLDLTTGEEMRTLGEDPRVKEPRDPLAKGGFAKGGQERSRFRRVDARDRRQVATIRTLPRRADRGGAAAEGQECSTLGGGDERLARSLHGTSGADHLRALLGGQPAPDHGQPGRDGPDLGAGSARGPTSSAATGVERPATAGAVGRSGHGSAQGAGGDAGTDGLPGAGNRFTARAAEAGPPG